jgi:TRAP-type C4-dicarboxylate transport system permease small subunit
MREPGSGGETLPTRILGYVCAALIAFMAFAMSVQVIGRYAIHNPPDWTEELARVAFLYATFLGAALAVARRAHLGIDLVANALPTRARAIFQIIWRLVACTCLAVIAYQGYFLVQRLSGQPLTSVPVSKGFMFASVPIGCVLVLIYELGRIIAEFRVFRTGIDPHRDGIVPRAAFVVETHKD